MREQRRHREILDTSVVIELERLDARDLPVELAVSAAPLADLAAPLRRWDARPAAAWPSTS